MKIGDLGVSSDALHTVLRYYRLNGKNLYLNSLKGVSRTGGVALIVPSRLLAASPRARAVESPAFSSAHRTSIGLVMRRSCLRCDVVTKYAVLFW